MTRHGSLVWVLWLTAACGAPNVNEPARSPATGSVEIASAPAASDTEDEPLPDRETPRGRSRIGRPVHADTYTLTVKQVTRCEPKYDFSKPAEGRIWLGVEIVIEGASSSPVWANPMHATLFDASEQKYRHSYALSNNCQPTLRARQLELGAIAGGWIVFDVPESARSLSLTYEQLAGGESQKVEIDLGL